ncbi:MAG: FAD-dependent oxidoreductase, partial [Propionicimonas sp.]
TVARRWARETTVRTQVAVLGAGTGGLLAAVAAARSGAAVHAVEASGFVGGVGTVGGIHVYWFGAPGGLQAELDERTRVLMRAFGNGPLSDGPFNPWAKLIAAEEMLRESGAQVTRDATMFEVERDGDRLVAVRCATPDGILRLEADAFIDATGDGDLCALAGVPFRLGREGDGLLHAYSQSSGRLRQLRGQPRMDTVNFDAGFCDPTDPTDLTRARQQGIATYLIDGRFDEFERPTYLAPALGVRQGRQVETDLILSLDDLIGRRRFPDSVGYTAAHFDNHATDLQFESDEAVFYQWVLEQSATPIACELSYRHLLPRGLANVWIGSRCLGLTQEAQYVTRMQRDIQRVGEVAGLAAALAVADGTHARSLDVTELQRRLIASSALGTPPRALETTFGLYTRVADDGRTQFRPQQATDEALLGALGDPDPAPPELATVLDALDAGMPDASLWWAMRHPESCRSQVLARTGPDSGEMTSWLAATISAMWGEPAAEPRLVAAIERLESSPPRRRRRAQEGSEAGPGESARTAPRWLTAVVLLRRCGTATCIPALAALASRPTHSVDALGAIARTIARLASRLAAPADRAGLRDIVERLEAVTVLGTLDYSARDVGAHTRSAVLGQTAADHISANHISGAYAAQLHNAYQDRTWQLTIALADARRALDMQVALPQSLIDSPVGSIRRAARLRTPAE